MAGGVFSGAKLNGMTIRESATDGSDFTNPDADYRRLFLGEDGFLHVKDSAGTVTDPYDTSGSGIAETILDAKGDLIAASAADTAAKLTVGANGSLLTAASGETTGLKWNAGPTGAAYKRTSGNYTTSSSSIADVDGTNLALTITTLARRVRIGVVCTLQHSSGGGQIYLDVAVDGTDQGQTSGTLGLVTTRIVTANYHANGSFTYLTDVLSAGSHTFKLRWATSGATATMFGGSSNAPYMQMWVEETLLTA